MKVKGIRVGCSCAHPVFKVISPGGKARVIHEGIAPPKAFAAELGPGETGLLEVRYETLERKPIDSELEQPVTFFLEDPKVPRIDCLMKVRILRRLDFSPAQPSFGEIPPGERGVLTLDLKPLPGRPTIHVTGFLGTGKHLEAKVLKESPAFTRILFRTKGELPTGYFHLPVIIWTDVDGRYGLPLFLDGRIVPELSLTPPSPLSLGRILPGRESSTMALLEWRGPGRPLHPKVARVEGPKGTKVELKPALPGKAWHLRIGLKIPPGAKIPPHVKGKVVLETGYSKQPFFTVEFQGFIRSGTR